MGRKSRKSPSAGQERKDVIQPPDEVLQHRALPRALSAHHRDLRQIQVATLADGAKGVLELVDEGNEVLHPPVSHDAGRLLDPAGSVLLCSAVRKAPGGCFSRKKNTTTKVSQRNRDLY